MPAASCCKRLRKRLHSVAAPCFHEEQNFSSCLKVDSCCRLAVTQSESVGLPTNVAREQSVRIGETMGAQGESISLKAADKQAWWNLPTND